MSFLLNKSEENKNAFAFLKDRKINAPCVHCGYYSCFQKITYILREYFTQEYNDIHKLLNERRKGSLHDEYIREFTRQYVKKFDKKEGHNLGRKLKDLKAFRREADYDDIEIQDDLLDKVEENMNEFHLLVKRRFEL